MQGKYTFLGLVVSTWWATEPLSHWTPSHFCRAVNPPLLEILRIDREGMIDDVITFNTWRHLRKKDTRWLRSSRICDDAKCAKKDVVGIVTFDLIGLLPTNHIIAYITMAYRRFLRKSLVLTAKTTQNIWNIIVGKSSLQEMANFGDYPWDFRL